MGQVWAIRRNQRCLCTGQGRPSTSGLPRVVCTGYPRIPRGARPWGGHPPGPGRPRRTTSAGRVAPISCTDTLCESPLQEVLGWRRIQPVATAVQDRKRSVSYGDKTEQPGKKGQGKRIPSSPAQRPWGRGPTAAPRPGPTDGCRLRSSAGDRTLRQRGRNRFEAFYCGRHDPLTGGTAQRDRTPLP